MRSLRRDLPSGNALFFFEAAARLGNLTRAAEELYVTQPAVSRMLARMEEHLGLKLFQRVRTGIELTENGRILYRKVAEAFGAIEAGISEAQARATGLEAVTLSASSAFTMHWLLPRLHRLKEDCPTVDLRLHLNPGRVGEPLVDVDLCVGILREDENYENRVAIMPETLIPIYSCTYLEAAERNQVETFLLMGDSEYGWHERFDGFARPCDSTTTLRLDDYSMIVQAAIQGRGIALGWLNVVTGCILADYVLPAPCKAVTTSRECSIVSRGRNPNRDAVCRVRDWIVEEMRNELRRIDVRFPQLCLTEQFSKTGIALA